MWYLLAASLFFLPFRLRISLGLLVVSLIVAVLNHTLQPVALLVLVVMAVVAFFCFRRKESDVLAKVGEGLLVLSAGALMLHLVPGFTNLIVVAGAQAGPESAPFTFNYNLDKALVPFLLLGCLPGLLKRPATPPRNRLWWLILLLSLPLLLLIATLAGGLRVELHYPEWLGSFMLANLFFVSFAEEALFRGWLQQRLSQRVGNGWGLLAASVLFGLAHAAGGVMLICFATVAGLIYGLAWLWSGRVWVSTLVHFAFNMLHLLFFTYPLWQHPPG
ncbi:CPBP family intramembrane glutamic endopeptidase [Pantoea sp. CCBC3-3-1]|uniref:CPBP family intramembrane glutamic endopeptidase n=1 Tax=Pantoea sp. CCBC3-3-1 TaxID=2490851 RepID=UPI0011BD5D25|nr:CPBP family intramembrane glutamic endopeptidase [Pantoea sp. CCBC3-3-1]